MPITESASLLLDARLRSGVRVGRWRSARRPPPAARHTEWQRTSEPFDLAEPFELLRARPGRGSRSSSARSSATGSSRATRTSGRSSRTRRRSRRRTRRRRTSRAPGRDPGDLRRRRAVHRLLGLSARQPPDHTRLRGFIKKAFTPRRVAGPRAADPRARRVEMIDACSARAGRPRADARHELPALVIFRLLGVPDEDVPHVKRWAVSRVALNFGDLPSRSRRSTRTTWCATGATASSWSVALRRPARRPARRPRAHLPEGDDSLSIDEIGGLVYTQLIAGHETTSSLLAGGLKELLEPARSAGRTSAPTPSSIPAGVEEMLRISTPVFAWRRLTKTATRVGDVDLPRGLARPAHARLGEPRRDDVRATPRSSTSPRRTPATTSRSGSASTSASARRSRGWRPRSSCGSSRARMPDLHLVDGPGLRVPRNTTFRGAHAACSWRGRAASDHVLGFDHCGSEEVATVGGKAASLGTMLQAGLPVPDGFAVTTRRVLRETLGSDVAGRISARPRGARHRRRDGARGRGRPAAPSSWRPRRCRPTSRDAIRAAYAALAARRRPGRGALQRDRGGRRRGRFAGQQDTYLWVVGEDAVLDARPPLLGEPVLGALDRLPRGSRHRARRRRRWASSSSGWCGAAPRAWR